MCRGNLIATACLGTAVILGVVVCRAENGTQDSATSFATFVDEYFDNHFSWNPSEGTAAGFHRYDTQLEDRSAGAIAKQIATSKQLLQRLEKLRRGKLAADEAMDAEILDGQLRAELLNLEIVGNWRRNPMSYVAMPGEAINGLMKRSFAPPADRLRSMIVRLKAIPPLLAALRANVENPPREFTELSIQISDGSVSFFRDTVRDWAKEAAGSDAALFAEFNAANSNVLGALQETATWLKQDLLLRSKGSYALGAENFARKLLYEEMVDTPLDKLLAIGEAALQRDQEAFAATARKIDPKGTPAEVMQRLSQDHPSETDLIPAANRTLEKIRQFAVDKHIVTIPSEVRPNVMETPPYARIGVFASMDTPGACETQAKEAYYYVTPVEKHWDAKHKEEHLRLFNNPVLQVVTIHEAFPGHFIQFLYAQDYPTKTRKLTYCGSNVEGWAHYCEQMMVEEGYGDGDLKIRLAQLSEALLRDCRFIVAIKLHTQGMTVEQATRFFEQEGYQGTAIAYDEARRGAFDPTYLVYTLGKLQLYKLRTDYRKLKGDAYKLETFHNEFVTQGGIPIKLIRRILLPGDMGPAL
jgi:uncharacterized protein (DUF885 family)